MRTGWISLALAVAVVIGALAQETNPEPSLASEKLTMEESNRLLATGRAAYEDGLYRLSRHRLEELVAGAPGRRRQAEGALWLARVQLAEKNPQAAWSTLEAYGDQLSAAALSAEYALARAQTRFDLGQLSEAAVELQEFKGMYTDQESAPRALHLLVRILAAQDDWAAAQAICDLIESRHPGHPEVPAAWLDLANALVDAGQLEEAQTTLAHVEDSYAGQVWSERAALKILELQLSQGEQPQAIQRMQEWTANTNLMAETRAQGYQIVAQALGAESNYVAALDMIEQGIAAATDPGQRLESQGIQARLLMLSGQVEEGTERMRSVAAQMPDKTQAAQLQLALAEGLAQLGKWYEAAAEYQSWLDAFDGEAGTGEALSGRAWALWSAGRAEEAVPLFERAAGSETNPALRSTLMLKRADSLFASRQFTKAKAAYAAVLEAAPTPSELRLRAQLQLAETELVLGDTEAGEIRLLDLSRAKKESEFSRKATMRLGSLYEERGALETATEQYGRLVDLCTEPETCAAALLARGLILYRRGSFQPALEDFLRIRNELPQTEATAQATFMRGWCLYLLGKDAEALQVCKQFLLDFPSSEFAPDVRFWLGEHAFNAGEYEMAEERFVHVATDHPDSAHAADALFWAGRAATARREYLAANEHYNTLMASYPESSRIAETLLAQGDVLSELGQFAAAILAFNEVIVKFPQQPEAMIAWGRKGDCQYTLGQDNTARYEEALLSYRTLLDFAGAPLDLRLQAGFKVGRCLEKMGRAAAALDRYMEVVYSFLQENQPPAEATVWFTRAAFGAAALQEGIGNWKEAVGIYTRVADSGTPSAVEASDRIDRIRKEHWAAF